MKPESAAIVASWQSSGQAHGNLWMFYIIVVSGILGFTFSQTFDRVPGIARGALLVLLIVFLLTNLISICNNLEIYNAATLQLKELSSGPPLRPVAHAIEPISQFKVAALHLGLDLCALLVVGVKSFDGTRRPTRRRS